MKTHCKSCGAPRRRALEACDYCGIEYEPAAASTAPGGMVYYRPMTSEEALARMFAEQTRQASAQRQVNVNAFYAGNALGGPHPTGVLGSLLGGWF